MIIKSKTTETNPRMVKNIKKAVTYCLNKERIIKDHRWYFVSEFLFYCFKEGMSLDHLIKVVNHYCYDDYRYNCGFSCRLNKEEKQLELIHDGHIIAYAKFKE